MKCISLTKFPNSNTYTACGQCNPCRINRKKEWKTKLLLEEKYYGDQTAFVTLTYSTEDLPREINYGIKYLGGTLSKPDAQKFIMRFRRNYQYEYGQYTDINKIRYFMVGEYGTQNTKRAHYHVILFGVDPVRAEKIVQKSWTLGKTQTDLVRKGGMEYVCGYTMKKMTSLTNFPDGREPEFSIKSTLPALGHVQIPKIAKALTKHGIVVGSTAWESFMLEENRFADNIFSGILGQNFHMRLDKPFKQKLSQYMSPNKQETVTNLDTKYIVLPKPFKIRQQMAQHQSYNDKMENIRNGENEKSQKKADKIFRRSSDKEKI